MKRKLRWVGVALTPVLCAQAFGQVSSDRIEGKTVYEVTREPSVIEVESARFLFRAAGDRLWVEKLYVIENRTDPPRTFYAEEGTFRFQLPSSVSDTASVTASGIGGTPVAQSVFPLPDGSGYTTQTAFKPGLTDIVISYEVDYGSQRYVLREESHYRLPKLLILVEPSDIRLDADGWEDLSSEPGGRFSLLRRTHLPAGSPIELVLSGGDSPAVARTGAVLTMPAPGVTHGQVTRLPDRTRTEKSVLVLLMGVALAFGLIASLASPRMPR